MENGKGNERILKFNLFRKQRFTFHRENVTTTIFVNVKLPIRDLKISKACFRVPTTFEKIEVQLQKSLYTRLLYTRSSVNQKRSNRAIWFRVRAFQSRLTIELLSTRDIFGPLQPHEWIRGRE